MKLKHRIPVQLKFSHFKGRQANEQSMRNLFVPVQLNVLMDRLEKDLLRDNMEINPLPLPGYHLGFFLPTHTNRIYQKFKEELYDSIMMEKGHAYWILKESYKVEDIPNINWKDQQTVISSLNKLRQERLVIDS